MEKGVRKLFFGDSSRDGTRVFEYVWSQHLSGRRHATNKLRATDRFLVFLSIHAVLVLANMYILPAMLLQLATIKQFSSVFRIKEVLAIATAGIGEYLFIAIWPVLAGIAICLCAMTVVGLLVALPALPLAVFAHARMMGYYYRANVEA